MGIAFVVGLTSMAYEKVKKLLGHKKPSTPEPETSEGVDKFATLACWKCQQSVPMEEYSDHVDQCVLQKPKFRV